MASVKVVVFDLVATGTSDRLHGDIWWPWAWDLQREIALKNSGATALGPLTRLMGTFGACGLRTLNEKFNGEILGPPQWTL